MDKSFILDYLPKNSKGLEIGVWMGEFSETIHNKLTPTALYLCDPWEYIDEYPDRWYGGSHAKSQNDMDNIYNNVVDKFKNSPEVTIIKDYSNNLYNYIDRDSLDWTYIDGNHSYEYVLKDLEISYDLIKNEGYITGDDFDDRNDIYKAVYDFCTKYQQFIIGALIEKRQFILQLRK